VRPCGYLAVDLGAESGRVMLAVLDGDAIRLREVHRFPNLARPAAGGLRWDLAGLFAAVVEGLRRGTARARAEGVELRSVGVDAWGVDYGLLGADGRLLDDPFCYRDARCGPASRRAEAEVGAAAIHAATGIQFLEFNTLYQLVADRDAAPERLAAADRLLFVPDLIHHLLCGSTAVEATIASTSQMIDPRTGDWARGLLARLRLPTAMLGRIVPPGTRLGALRPEIAARVGAALEVVAPAAHDTASAVVAVPARADRSWCFLSSGTWSLLGVELDAPCFADPEFTNEAGVGGTFRFLKNVSGLWLVQQCRLAWAAAGQDFDYDELERLAVEAGPARLRLDPDDPPFRRPGQMPDKIAAFARRTGQPVPDGPGAIVRACLEGLAGRYLEVLERIENLLGRRFDVIHVVGGGSRNALLNRLTAEVTGREVVAGPVEATALGNALVQAMADGRVADLADARRRVARFTEGSAAG
jgi:rhamnulokinase